MRLVSRGGVLLAALAALAGCGGSVADADTAAPTRERTAPSSPFCLAARANTDAVRPLNALVARGGAAPAELSDTVGAVRRAGVELVSSAPAEIRSDVERTVGAADVQLNALLAGGGDGAAAAGDPDVTSRLSSPELVSSEDTVRAYIAANCTTAG